MAPFLFSVIYSATPDAALRTLSGLPSKLIVEPESIRFILSSFNPFIECS